MHAPPQDEAAMTDSMRIFEWGRKEGRPAPGMIGIAPEWFYKGDGFCHPAALCAAAYPCFCRRRRRRSRSRRDLYPCERWHAASHWHGCRQRVFRPRLRAPQLPQSRRIETPHLQPRSRARHCARLQRRPRHGPHHARQADSLAKNDPHRRRQHVPQSCRISSITTSNFRETASPAWSTSTFSAPTRSPSAKISASAMATSWKYAFEGFGRPAAQSRRC